MTRWSSRGSPHLSLQLVADAAVQNLDLREGTGSGGEIAGLGGYGSDGQNSTSIIGGNGGQSFMGGGGRAATTNSRGNGSSTPPQGWRG